MQAETDLFILHEGTKVSIKSKLGDWNEIEMEDGNVGWMQQRHGNHLGFVIYNL